MSIPAPRSRCTRTLFLAVPLFVAAFIADASGNAVAATWTTVQPSAADDPVAAVAAVERIGQLMRDHYVFPDVADASARELERQLGDGTFSGELDAEELSGRLTEALRVATNDKHMLVRPRRRLAPPEPASAPAGDTPADNAPRHPLQDRADRVERARASNFGFEAVERLEGNVGYIDVRMFSGMREARTTASAAMAFLSGSDALIFDMRQNGGGDPDMVRYLCSYLFTEPTHLNSLYWRDGDRTQEFWTVPVPGVVRGDVPVFVLTSSRTFSGAEEFSYNLRTRERARLVGETTRGGANPGTLFPVSDAIEIFIPTGRAINPITGTNWEGTGVEPHVTVPADDALTTALPLAIEAAEAYRMRRADRWSAFDPWLADVQELVDAGDEAAAKRRLEAQLSAAVALGHLPPGAVNDYGYQYLSAGHIGLALVAFELNARHHPTMANAHDSLGEGLRAAKRISESIRSYERAVALEPDGPNADAARAAIRDMRAEQAKKGDDGPRRW
ncbi:MAG: S41 family peptidase [Phycisphaerales bacterium]